ncbi:MAG: transposase [Alphaproteobacteria bacterium]
MILKGWCTLGAGARETAPRVRIVCLRLKTGELLALACPGNPRRALARYRERWTIETLFGNLKTRGFDMEATHMTNPEKLSTLTALLALATALSVKTGAAANRLKPIPVKKHGRRAVSLFALGLATLRKILAAAKPDQLIAFLALLLSPKLPLKPLKGLRF